MPDSNPLRGVAERPHAHRASPLRTVRTVHTLIWAFFAACIVAIPLLAWAGRLGAALVFIGIVSIEVLVLGVFGALVIRFLWGVWRGRPPDPN